MFTCDFVTLILVYNILIYKSIFIIIFRNVFKDIETHNLFKNCEKSKKPIKSKRIENKNSCEQPL